MKPIIKKGDTLVRVMKFLQSLHFGIVITDDDENIDMDKIQIMEFNIDGLLLVDFKTFLWGESIFWIYRYTEEKLLYGNNIIYPPEKIVIRAIKHYLNKDKFLYTVDKKNCEYFTRKCSLTDKNLWKSKQIQLYSRNKRLAYTKLASMVVINIISAIFKSDYNIANDLHIKFCDKYKYDENEKKLEFIEST